MLLLLIVLKSKSGQKSVLSDMGSSAVERKYGFDDFVSTAVLVVLVDIEYILSQALLNQVIGVEFLSAWD